MTLIALGFLILVVAFFAVPLIDTLKRIAEGIEKMADLEAAAIANLDAGVDAIVAVVTKLAAAAATAVPPVDHSPEINAAVKKLTDAVAAVSAPAAPVPAAPAAPSA